MDVVKNILGQEPSRACLWCNNKVTRRNVFSGSFCSAECWKEWSENRGDYLRKYPENIGKPSSQWNGYIGKKG